MNLQALDTSKSVVVEACAGSGKTWLLSSRIARAILEGTPPRSILALTFTKKAAAEMRARVVPHLKELATLASPSQPFIAGIPGLRRWRQSRWPALQRCRYLNAHGI